MSSPNKRISPSMRASGFSSCIRFNARRKVDLPQPLGPMMAVTALAAMSSETFFSTSLAPKKIERLRAVSAAEVLGIVAMKSALALETVARQETHAGIEEQHQHEQHERAGPGLPMPVVVGRNRVGKNLERHRGDGFGEAVRPKTIAQRGE